MDHAPLLPDDFNGRVRLFPLPNSVLFPHVLQPLHVFEPRYRELTIDALATDQLIAMALLEPGWEKEYEGKPSISQVACLAKIVSHQRLDDGRYNLLLAGLHRVKIVREMHTTKPFRTAQVEIIEDYYSPLGEPMRPMLFRKLIDEFIKRFMPKLPEAREQIEQLLGSEIPLGPVTDIISYTLDLAMAQKQELLGQADVDRRAVLLADIMDRWEQYHGQIPRRPGKFPPEFSAN